MSNINKIWFFTKLLLFRDFPARSKGGKKAFTVKEHGGITLNFDE
jgi:hypothetical protein